jgi:hypothetical protein
MSTMADNYMFRQLGVLHLHFTYLMADFVYKEAVLIDPVIELSARDASLVKELDLKLKYVINTHVHADHITATGRLKKLVPGVKSVILANSGGKDGDKILFGCHSLVVAETPGHTEGSPTSTRRLAVLSQGTPSWSGSVGGQTYREVLPAHCASQSGPRSSPCLRTQCCTLLMTTRARQPPQ